MDQSHITVRGISAESPETQPQPLHTTGNGNGHHRKALIHLRRYLHHSACGLDLSFYVNTISSHKASDVTCPVCDRARRKFLLLRRKAKAFDRLSQ
jgi:hypothetical protein